MSTMSSRAHRTLRTSSGLVSVFLASLTVFLEAFQWDIVDIVTPFLMFPIYGTVWTLALIAFLWSSALWAFSRWTLKGSLPLLGVVACLAIAWAVPLSDLWVQWNFRIHKRDRERIVHDIENGSLQPDSNGVVHLSSSDPHVSKNGNMVLAEVHDGKTYVFFFTFAGVLDNYSGFLYVPEGGDPTKFADLNEKDSTKIVAFDGHWHFASHR